jgi:hypothetical protein
MELRKESRIDISFSSAKQSNRRAYSESSAVEPNKTNSVTLQLAVNDKLS